LHDSISGGTGIGEVKLRREENK